MEKTIGVQFLGWKEKVRTGLDTILRIDRDTDDGVSTFRPHAAGIITDR